MSKNPKNWRKLMKIANIVREILHIFGTTCEISMKFSGKIWLMIILKVAKNQAAFHPLFSRYIFLKKNRGGGKINPPPPPRLSPAVLGLKWQYSETWLFSIVDIYHFWLFLMHLLKKINPDIIGYWVIGGGC